MKPSEIRQLQIDTKYIIIGSILQKLGTVIKWQRVLKCTCSKVLRYTCYTNGSSLVILLKRDMKHLSCQQVLGVYRKSKLP